MSDERKINVNCSECPLLNFEESLAPVCSLGSPVDSYTIKTSDGEYEELFYSGFCILKKLETTDFNFSPDSLTEEDVLCEHSCDECASCRIPEGNCMYCKHSNSGKSGTCMFYSKFKPEEGRKRNGSDFQGFF
ncbi:MAG: hypothetical protein ACLFQK_03820 [Fibrobacterota bacterium]